MQIEEHENKILKTLKDRGLAIQSVKVCEICHRRAFLVTKISAEKATEFILWMNQRNKVKGCLGGGRGGKFIKTF